MVITFLPTPSYPLAPSPLLPLLEERHCSCKCLVRDSLERQSFQ